MRCAASVPVFACLFIAACGPAGRKPLLPVLPPQPPALAHADRDDDSEEREDGYEEAAAFYLLQRAPDARNLPAERYLAAKEKVRSMRRYSLPLGRFLDATAKGRTRDAALGTWAPLGPGNIGGRTRSLVIDPTNPAIMYAGAVGGGVWKTTDGGASWLPLTDLLPSIGISTLAMDPANSSVLYAGTGEWYTTNSTGNSIRGLGIFKTADGGATWTQLPGAGNSNFWYVNKVVVSPNNSNQLYAATYGGVFASTDGGATWALILRRDSPNSGCQDLVIRNDQPTDYLFAACGTVPNPPTAIFRNVDAAGSGQWESVFSAPNMARTSLALAPSSQSIVYAVSATLELGNYRGGLLAVYQSASNGDSGSWQTQVANTDPNRLNTALFTNPREMFADVCSNGTPGYVNQGGYDNAIAVDPTNPNSVWVGGVDLFRSDDGGANWGIAAFWQAGAPQLVHADNHAIVFHPNYDGASNQTLYATGDGGVYETDNALAAVATGPLAPCPPYPTKVAWKSLNHGYAATQFYAGAVYPGGSSYFGGAQDNGTTRGSGAQGSNQWIKLLSGDGGVVAIDPNDANIVYGETEYLNLEKSTNGGLTFQPATAGITGPSSDFLFIAPYVMDPSQSTRLYLGGRSLWRSNDGAMSWTAASAPIPAPSGLISAMAVSPADPNTVFFGTSLGFIYSSSSALSTDATAAWPSSQPRSGYVSGIAFDPNNPGVAYATYSQFKQNPSQSHVYMTADGGNTWTGIDGSGATGLPDIPVFSLIADPQNSSNLYLGTDIGVFVSLDGGNTWAPDDNPFADAVTETLVLDRSAGAANLYAFTHGRGVWVTTLPNSGTPCQYQVPATPLVFDAIGGQAPVPIATGDNCSWSAVGFSGPLTVVSPANGTGPGTVSLTAAVNIYTFPVAGAASVQGQKITMTQRAALVAANNDRTGNPQRIFGLPYVGIEDTRSDTQDPGDPTHSCTGSADFKTVWWTVTAPSTGTMNLTAEGIQLDASGPSGIVLTAYAQAGGAIGNELACATIPRGTGARSTGAAQIAVTQGSSYTIEVSATGATASDGGYTILTAAMAQ
ncbi:MAG: hypothetical protein ABI165_18160 [Bryobacteraceae bacterium]